MRRTLLCEPPSVPLTLGVSVLVSLKMWVCVPPRVRVCVCHPGQWDGGCWDGLGNVLDKRFGERQERTKPQAQRAADSNAHPSLSGTWSAGAQHGMLNAQKGACGWHDRGLAAGDDKLRQRTKIMGVRTRCRGTGCRNLLCVRPTITRGLSGSESFAKAVTPVGGW